MYHYRKVYVQCSAVELMWGSLCVGWSIDLISKQRQSCSWSAGKRSISPSSKVKMILPEISILNPVNRSFICLHSSRSNAGFARLSWQPHLSQLDPPHILSSTTFACSSGLPFFSFSFFVFHFLTIVPFLSVRTTYLQRPCPTIIWRDSYQIQSKKLLVNRKSPNQNGQPASQRTALPGRAHGLAAASW